MAYKRPDVYIEEILTPELAPQGVSTSIASFVGATERGPANTAVFVDSFDSFKRIFGDNAKVCESIFYSVRTFFENGGSACYIVRAVSSSQVDGANPPAKSAGTDVNNAASAAVVNFSAGYRGLENYGAWGTSLSVDIDEVGVTTTTSATTAIVSGDTSVKVASVSGINVGDIIFIEDSTTASEYFKVEKLQSDIVLGSIEHTIFFTTAATTAIAVSADLKVIAYNIDVLVNNEVVESFVRVSLDPDSDRYIETLFNDEQTGSLFVKVEDKLPTSSVLSNNKEFNATVISTNPAFNNNGQNELTNFNVSTDLGLALTSLDAKDSVNLLTVPTSLASSGIFPSTSSNVVHVKMLNYVQNRMDMFAILDAPSGKTAGSAGSGSIGDYVKNNLGVDSFWGALYYPHIKVPKVLGKTQAITIPPSGAIAGLYSRVDSIGTPNGGVASAPAGVGEFGRLDGILNVEVEVSEVQHGDLNVMGVNCLRILESRTAGVSVNVLGARTLSSGLDFRYLNVRRMMNFLEKRVKTIGEASLFRNNGPALWSLLTSEIESFLTQRFQAGELAGNSLDEAFFVKIDSSNNTANNIRQGILVGEIGVALLRPAEFIVFKFSQVQVA